MKILDKLNSLLEEGKISNKSIGKFSFESLAEIMEEHKNDAWKELGYKSKYSLVNLLDNNITYTRKRGETWYNILTDVKEEKTVYGIGVDDMDVIHYHDAENGLTKVNPYFDTYKRMLKNVKRKRYGMCKEWLNSLSAFHDWYMENHKEGARMKVVDNLYSPETTMFVGGKKDAEE